MAQNLSGDRQHKTVGFIPCLPDFIPRLLSHLTFLSVLNSFTSVTAFLGNVLILIALHKESSLHPPSKLLLRNLATTDLCVGVIAEPLFVAYCMSIVNEHWYMFRYASPACFTTGNIFCGVSMLTLTAISVDRLRYRQVVTLKRTYVIVITSWVLPAVLSAMIFWNPSVLSLHPIIVIPLCLCLHLLLHKDFLHPPSSSKSRTRPCSTTEPNKSTEHSAIQNDLTVSTVIWLQLTMLARYLPYNIVSATVLMSCRRLSSSLFYAWHYTSTLVYFNSSLNPILYCWKLEEVRQAVKDTIYNETSVLLLFFELDLVDQYNRKG